MDCPRCGTGLVVYRLGDRRALGCDACGYIGVKVDHHVERREDESWAEALERFENQHAQDENVTDPLRPAIVPVDEE